MNIFVKEDPAELGKEAGRMAARIIRHVIDIKGEANLILATGTSQFETLNQLTKEEIDWSRVVMFHLDEFIGLPESSPASFRRYLKERFIQKVTPLKMIYFVNGEGDPAGECIRLSEIIKKVRIDLALVGIGENGHLGLMIRPLILKQRILLSLWFWMKNAGSNNSVKVGSNLSMKCRIQRFPCPLNK